jgi:hypothetical protein
MPLRPLRAAASLTATLALVSAGIAATTSAAQAVPDPDVNTTLCPAGTANPTGTPIWTGGFSDGQVVHGLTTVKGTTPEAFQGTYVDTLTDDDYGNPIYLFDLSGSRITGPDGAGIWAGISGSPVYDADDNLIGSVSYSFTQFAGSTLAGITPAANIINADPTTHASAARSGRTVTLSKSDTKSLEAAGVPKASKLTQLKRLTAEHVVAGASAERATANAAKSRYLSRKSGNRDQSFGAAGLLTTPPPPIVAGGNIATTYSYGAITLASVGSVTAICGDGTVYAYGHPDENVGTSTQTILNASTASIVNDGPESYKMVNLATEPSGSLLTDNINGISGVLGTDPAVVDVVTHTTANGATVDRTTHVSTPYALPTVVSTQTGTDAYNAFKKEGTGDADMSWTITYTRSGEPGTQTFHRSQRYSVSQEFPGEVSYDAASDVEELASNPFEKVTISKVEITSNLLPDYNAVKPTGAQYLKSGVWKNVGSSGIKAKPGSTLKLRIKLSPADNDTTVSPTTVDASVHTSTSSHGSASINLLGQSYGGYGDFEFFGDECDCDCDDEECSDDPGPQDLDELIDLLASQPRQDDIVRVLSFRTKTTKKQAVKLVRSPFVTSGSLKIKVVFPK